MVRMMPQLCGSVSGRLSPLGLGAKMHEAGYAAAGLDWRYVSIEADDVRATISSFVQLGFRGFAVSMPFKIEILRYLHESSADVAAIGACNTVVNDEGRLTGHNTDWRGAIDAITEAGIEEPGTAIILGAGGAARALAYGLATAGWDVRVAARLPAAAQALTTQFQLQEPVALDRPAYPDIDLVVNTTPVADATAFLDLRRYPDAKAVFDVVFNPVISPFCEAARQKGLIAIPGWHMLLHQAAHQFTLYTGRPAPLSAMREALLSAIK